MPNPSDGSGSAARSADVKPGRALTLSRDGRLLFTLAVALLALGFLPLLGARTLSLSVYWGGGDELDGQLIWTFRVARVVAAMVAGGALAMCGCAFQALFRNGLADPFTLGVSSGAAAGMAVAVHWGVGALAWGVSGLSACAFAGAVLATGVVYGLSRWRRGFTTGALLLAGVAVNFFFGAVVTLLQLLGNPHNVAVLTRALVGGVSVVGYGALGQAAPFIVVGTLLVTLRVRELDLLACGEDLARTRGVAVGSVRRQLFWGVSLATGGVVALCGPVGFVGLMAPHICRFWLGPRHRWLLPGSALFGATLLAVADAVARVAIRPAELPAGVLTALCGGPFFLALLLRDGPEASINN